MGASAAIDFGRQKPERVRGVGVPKTVNWDALNLVVQTTEGSVLQKEVFRRRFFKAIRQNGVGAMTPWFRYHYVCARIAMGDFSDYWGWEFRGLKNEDEGDSWAAKLYWEETWLPKWGGAGVNRLLVLGEQGVGDQIFFASILPEALVRCREVIYECDERLHKMLERSLKGLKCGFERQFEDRRRDYGEIDAYIPAAELMRMFRRNRGHFPGKPYLRPDQARLVEFDGFAGAVGLSWQGRQGSLDPQRLGLERPVSLQYDAKHPDTTDPGIDLKNDLEGVLALCSVLSRVVTVPTTVHHISGACGTRTEIILPEHEGVGNQVKWDCSPMIADGRLPWYYDARVFKTIGDWKRQ